MRWDQIVIFETHCRFHKTNG